MELLDATIALAVTLAALATSVTVLMEIVVRSFGLKSKGQVELFKQIYNQSFKKHFKGANSEFNFVVSILQNPLTHQITGAKGKRTGLQPAAISKPRLRDHFGGRGSGVFNQVSTEHVFRHVLALPGVLDDGREKLINKLKQFNVEYNQLCAAASTSYKNNRHRWSVIIGVVLAISLNVNGLRIFEAFMANSALTAATVEKLETWSNKYDQVQLRLEQAIKDNAGDVADLKKRAVYLQAQLGDLQGMGIPIGWEYSPHCNLPGWSCRSGAEITDSATASSGSLVNSFAELITCVITGLLIGLGAPFWFDLAKRLAQVRTMFGGKASAADSFNGETPIVGTAEYDNQSTNLITRIIDQAIVTKQQTGTRKLLTERREL